MTTNAALTLGKTTVHRVIDLDPFAIPIANIFPNATLAQLDDATQVLAERHVDFATGKILLVIQSHLVRFAGKTILIDACVGEHKSRPLRPEWNLRTGTKYLANLAAAGCTPEDIDIVMCTHLHADHLGWNTRLQSGRWVPTFSNARYVMTQREIDQRAQDAAQSPQANHGSYQDSVLPVIEAGLVKTVNIGDEIVDGAKIIDLAGHSPGQIGLDLAADATITADILRRRHSQPSPGFSPRVVKRLLLRPRASSANAPDAPGTRRGRRIAIDARTLARNVHAH